MIYTKELEAELKEIPPAEILAAMALVSAVEINPIINFLMHKPPISDFARALVGKSKTAEDKELREIALTFLSSEYPELYDCLEEIIAAVAWNMSDL